MTIPTHEEIVRLAVECGISGIVSTPAIERFYRTAYAQALLDGADRCEEKYVSTLFSDETFYCFNTQKGCAAALRKMAKEATQ